MKTICIEFSNILTDENRSLLDISNRELFYNFKHVDGYIKTKDFTEFPQWVNYINGIVDTELHICRNLEETIQYINDNKPEYVFFSLILANKKYIQYILNNCSIDNSINFIIGIGIGSSKLELNNESNVFQYNSMLDFIKHHNFNKDITLKRLPSNNNYIPRIYTSMGCNNNCLFCKNEGKYTRLSKDIISQYQNISCENRLTYVGNKTFLQGGKQELDTLKLYFPNRMFIVQSTVNTLNDSIYLFKDMYDIGVRIVEIGIESFSKKSLKTLGKHYSISDLNTVIHQLSRVGIKVIFNIIVGIKGETLEDHHITIDCLKEYKDNVYALNISNYTDYDSNNGIDQDERELVKSWHTSKELPQLFSFVESIYRLNYEIISNG